MRKIAIAAAAALFALSTSAFANGNGYGYGHKQKQQQASIAGSASVTEISENTNVEGDDYPAAQAWAAPLVATEDTCMGSSSAGVQGASFGVSFGSTWRDGDCVRRKDARLLHNMGAHNVAFALMCQKEAIAQAAADMGVSCYAEGTRELTPPPAEVLGEADTTTIAPVAEDDSWQYEN